MGVVVLQNCSAGGQNNTPEVFKDIVNNAMSFSVTAEDLKGLKTLKDYSFYNSKLSSIEIPSSSIVINNQSLLGCDNLESITGTPTNYTIVDNGISFQTGSKSELVKGCKNTNLSPSNLSYTYIGESAFGELKSIKSLNIPSGVGVYLDSYHGCSNIKYVQGAFEWVKLAIPQTGATNYKLSILDKVSLSRAFEDNTNIIDVEFPNGLGYLPPYAFNNTGLTRLVLTDNPNLSAYSFANCANLKYVEIPAYNSEHSVDSTAFSNSPIEEAKIHGGLLNIIPKTNLKKLELTGGTSIASSTFQNNSVLESITLPNTITTIYNTAFYNCTKLNYVNFNGTIAEWCSINFTPYGESSYSSTNPLSPGPSGTSNCGYLYLRGTRITEVVIPANQRVNAYSFRHAKINTLRFKGDANVRTAAFEYSSLSDVYFATSFPTIGGNVFDRCNNLVNIHYASTIGDLINNTYSGDNLYETLSITTNLKTLYVNNTEKVVDLVIPEGITNTGRLPYLDIKSLSIPSTVSTIVNNAFQNCRNLETITFAENNVLTYIPVPFYNCGNIKSITLPFAGSTPTPSSASASALFGVIFGTSSYTGATAVSQSYGSGTRTYYIPSGLTNVTVLGGKLMCGAFSNCSMITDLTIGENVSVNSNAFYGVNGLTNLIISPNNSKVFKTAFNGAIITNAAMPSEAYYLASREATITNLKMNGGKYIFPRMFDGDTTLTSLTLPNTIKKIGMDAFKDCSNLSNVDMPTSVSMLLGSLNSNSTNTTFNFDSSAWFNLIHGQSDIYINKLKLDGNSVSSIAIPSGVETLLPYAVSDFQFDGIVTSLSFPTSLTLIGSHSITLSSAYTQATLTIPGTVKKIDDNGIYIYSDFSQTLQNVVLSEGVEELGKSCIDFYGGRHTINIPTTVRKISPRFVDGYYTEFTLDSGNAYYTMASDCLIENSTGKLIKSGYVSSGSSSIPQNADITEICDYAFFRRGFYDSNYNPTAQIVPNGVTSIGEYAFYETNGIDSISLPATLTTLGVEAFRRCSDLTSVTFNNNCPLTAIPTRAFCDCSSLMSVNIPGSVSLIGSEAFKNCANLTTVTLPATLNKIGADAFNGCSSLMRIVLPNSLTQIGKGAFDDCTALQFNTYDNAYYLGTSTNPYYALIVATSTSITSCDIHSDCVIIADGAFVDCYSLSEITIPASVRYIGYKSTYENDETYSWGAFFGTSITKVNLDSLDDWASVSLYNYLYDTPLSSITSIYINGVEVTDLSFTSNISRINDNTFFAYSKATSITLPNSITSVGSRAFNVSSSQSLVLSDNLTSVEPSSFGHFYNSIECSNRVQDANGNYYAPSNTNSYYMLIQHSYNKTIDSSTVILYNTNITTATSSSVEIPTSVICIAGAHIGNRVASLSMSTDNAVYSSVDNCIIKTATRELVMGCDKSVIPNDGTVTTICTEAFYYSVPDSITIPSSITTLETECFTGSCSYLEIPDTVVNLKLTGDETEFHLALNNIVTLKLGSAFKTIPRNLCEDNYYLTTVYLSNSIEDLGDYSFTRCPVLTDIYYSGTKYQFSKVNKHSDNFDQYDFDYYDFDNYTKYVTIHCTDGDI